MNYYALGYFFLLSDLHGWFGRTQPNTKEMQRQAAQKMNGTQDAQPIFQKLGKEAQELVEVKEPVVIKKLFSSVTQKKKITGRCCNGEIFINEEAFKKHPEDARVTLIHEAIHKKQFEVFGNNDQPLNHTYNSAEQEAYFEAARLCNCYVCSGLYAYNMPPDNYKYNCPSRFQYFPIIRDQKARNVICPYHKKTTKVFRDTLINSLFKEK